jgi:hypothetical protein
MTTWRFKRTHADRCILTSSCGQTTLNFHGELAAHAAQDRARELRGITAEELARAGQERRAPVPISQ